MSNAAQDLLTTIDRVCEAHCGKAVREAAETGEWPGKLWRALEEVGITRAALPEAAGGAGLEFAEAMLALRRTAYHALPVPLAETMLAGRLLCAAGLPVPEGALTIAPVREVDRLKIAKGRERSTLSGEARRVPWGNQCARAVAVDEGAVALVATEGVIASAEKNLAAEPRATLRFEARPLEASAPLEGALERLLAEGALLRAVQMAGALERALELSLAYANERVQFGRPIGKFQAVQHMLAQLAAHAAASSAAADAAVEASAQAPEAFAVAVAKARASEAAGKAAEIAHQVHGAMGFTREHALHYSTRRLWSWRDEFGSEVFWQARLGSEAAKAGADALWPMLTRL